MCLTPELMITKLKKVIHIQVFQWKAVNESKNRFLISKITIKTIMQVDNLSGLKIVLKLFSKLIMQTKKFNILNQTSTNCWVP